MTPDQKAYYIYFYRGGKDPYENLHIVSKEIFDKILPFESKLSYGSYVPEVQDILNEVHRTTDLAAEFSPNDYDKIPDDHFIRVEEC